MAGVFCCRASEPHHEFRDMQGRKFSGNVVAFDASKQIVTVRRNDGKTGKMSLNVFCGPDQLYIRDWGISNDFMSGLNVSVQLVSSNVSSRATGVADVSKDIFEQGYKIHLENDSKSDFGRITVDYCIFYRQGVRNRDTVNYEGGIARGKTALAELPIGADSTCKTMTIKLFSEAGSQTIFGKIEDSKSNVKGIWLRLKTKLPSGHEVVREFRTSQDSSWKWSDSSVGVGLNKSAYPVPVLPGPP